MPYKDKEKQRISANKYARSDRYKDIRLRYRYGITMEQFKSMLTHQKGLCKICKKLITGLPHVDHDHQTGRIRGILCGLCNKGLGQFKDNLKIIQAAARYLKAASKTRGPELLKQVSTRAQGLIETA